MTANLISMSAVERNRAIAKVYFLQRHLKLSTSRQPLNTIVYDLKGFVRLIQTIKPFVWIVLTLGSEESTGWMDTAHFFPDQTRKLGR